MTSCLNSVINDWSDLGSLKANKGFSSKILESILFEEMALDVSAPFFVAYSGGMDSTVLLHAISRLGLKVTALHVDHGLQAESKQWLVHCNKICDQWGIDFKGAGLTVEHNKKIGLEASARNARYGWFDQIVSDNAYLLTAHHQRDQAETVLFNMLRGAGVNGLSAMPRLKHMNGYYHVRPLLNLPYETLQNYADKHDLIWIEDPTNMQTDFSRNKIRHNVLPALQEFRADAIAMISRTATNLADSRQLIDDVLDNDLSQISTIPLNPLDNSKGIELSRIGGYKPSRMMAIIKYWLERDCNILASRKLIQQLAEWVQSPPSSTAILQESGKQYRYNNGILYNMPELQEVDPPSKLIWDDLSRPLLLPELGIKLVANEKLFQFKNILVAFRCDDLQLTRNGKTLKLKEYMMEQKIPSWLRYRSPLLVSPDKDNSYIFHHIVDGSENDFCSVEKNT